VTRIQVVRSGQNGGPLDENWTAGSIAFPSGDGLASGDFAFHLNVLPGDVDANNVVNNNDYVLGGRISSTGPWLLFIPASASIVKD
jgi:hypothetical protein